MLSLTEKHMTSLSRRSIRDVYVLMFSFVFTPESMVINRYKHVRSRVAAPYLSLACRS